MAPAISGSSLIFVRFDLSSFKQILPAIIIFKIMLKKDKSKTAGGPLLSLDEIATLDRQISQLGDCRSLPETEIKNLCEKVSDY